ncbi:hypothetical protein MRB53_040356 [Persea americana]|nr:hypothetical protein MRB53_040356 [Persea americana]
METCLRRSIPVLFISLSLLAVSFATIGADIDVASLHNDDPGSITGYITNELLLGSQDVFFWFLVPLFGVISIGVCIALNFIVSLITHILASVYIIALESFSTETASRCVARLEHVRSTLTLCVAFRMPSPSRRFEEECWPQRSFWS